MLPFELLERFDEVYGHRADEYHVKKNRHYLKAILEGKRDLYAEVVLSRQFVFIPVQSIEEIRATVEVHPYPALIAVKMGYEPYKAYEQDAIYQQQLEEHPDMVFHHDDKWVWWIGDYDQYGAECGNALDIILPRSSDAPNSPLNQMAIDSIKDPSFKAFLDPDNF